MHPVSRITALVVAPTAWRCRRRLLLAGAAAGLLGGCLSTAPLNPGEWQLVPLPESEAKPTASALAGARRTRVVVFPTAESPSVPGVGLHLVAASTLESLLGKGGVEVVDRTLASRLDEEIKLVEVRGSGSYGGPDVADFALKVVMGHAGWSNRFVEASEYKDKKGQIVRTPASHTHEGSSKMTVRIYEIPSLRLVQEVGADGSFKSDGNKAAASATDAGALMRAATERGLTARRADLLNEFAAKGYVTERRTKGSDSIFRVMLGKASGAKAGDEVKIFSRKRNENPITKQVTFDEVMVASGRFTDVVGDGESWVRVTDARAAGGVRLGDVAKMTHSIGFLERVMSR